MSKVTAEMIKGADVVADKLMASYELRSNTYNLIRELIKSAYVSGYIDGVNKK